MKDLASPTTNRLKAKMMSGMNDLEGNYQPKVSKNSEGFAGGTIITET